ncbi:MAG: hypothetical protein HY748_06105 [Elusimicrobia bacterium]|nr:hypothetical protein [Elusimicrobiota bacterium]
MGYNEGQSVKSRNDGPVIELRVIEVAAERLTDESLPIAGIRMGPRQIDPRKFAALGRLVERFNSDEDPVITEVFGPLHGGRKFSVQIVATSGIPAPYDAWTATYRGCLTMFFNLSEWTEADLDRSGFGVLKHEVTHVLLEPLLRKSKTPDDVELLDSIVMDEGIAHFIGCPDRSSLLKEKAARWETAEQELEKAYAGLNDGRLPRERKAALLRRANTGSFWDKYGSISGMFRAAKLYKIKGADGLIEAIRTSKLPRP